MSDKPFKENDKWLNIAARGLGIIILLIVEYLTWFKNPNIDADKFTSETMWEAVHPFVWYKDLWGVIAIPFLFLFLLGLLDKVIKGAYNVFQREANTSGSAPAVAIVCAVLVILMYVW